MDKVDTVLALTHSVLGDAGLSDDGIKSLLSEIAAAGSLAVYTAGQEKKRKKLDAKVDGLTKQWQMYTAGVQILVKRIEELTELVSKNAT